LSHVVKLRSDLKFGEEKRRKKKGKKEDDEEASF
jgi:hypothetical protein